YHEGVFFSLTEHYEVVCVSHHCTLANAYPLGVMSYPKGSLHAMQCYVQQQWTYHAPLRCSRRSVVILPIFQIACLEPLLDERLTRHVTEGFQEELLVDVVKRTRDVRIHYYLLPPVRAGEAVDFLNGIVGVSPCPESVG